MFGLSYSSIAVGLKLANATSKMFKCLKMGCETVGTNALLEIKWKEK